MASETENERRPLTFHWPRPLEQGRRLIFWIVVVILGLAAFFYLFQVVYPQSQRRTPVPHQIMLLDPANPVARAILNKVRDRDFLVLPGEETTGSRIRLEDQAPVFHPSYENHRLELQDLPHKAFTVPPARLLKADEPVLPPLDLSELKKEAPPPAPGGDAPAPVLEMVLNGDLAGRKVATPPDLTGVTPVHPGGHKLQLVVDADGRVWFALPLRESDNLEVSRALADRLLRMRFAPLLEEGRTKAGSPAAPSSGSQVLTPPKPMQGTATFQWRKSSQP